MDNFAVQIIEVLMYCIVYKERMRTYEGKKEDYAISRQQKMQEVPLLILSSKESNIAFFSG